MTQFSRVKFNFIAISLAILCFQINIPHIAAIATGSPTRVYNEEWSLNMGQNDGANTFGVNEVAGSDDVMAIGFDYVAPGYIYYISRVAANGSIKWNRAFSSDYTPLDFTAAYNNITYVYGVMAMTSPQKNTYLYSLDSNTGEIIAGWTVNEHCFINSYGAMILNPSNPSELWIWSQKNSSSTYNNAHFFCWDLQAHNIQWEHVYDLENYDFPRDMKFIKGKLYCIFVSYLSPSINYQSRLVIINPETKSTGTPKVLKCGENTSEINARSLHVNDDYIYIIGENFTSLYSYKNSYFQRYNLDGTFISENLLQTAFDGYFVVPAKLHMIGDTKVILSGHESLDYLGEPDTGKYRIFVASYQYYLNENKLVLVSVQYYGESGYTNTFGDSVVIQNKTYVVGMSYSIVKGFRSGILIKFPSAFYEPPIETPDTSHWYDPLLLLGNWPFFGAMLGIGLLFGVLIGKKMKVKAGKK